MAKKYALCVGVNDYPGTFNDLSGCVNDAIDWSELLTQEGYTVVTLVNGAATKSEITRNLVQMIGELKWSDRLVFTFSGHGTWLPDRDGDEIDKRDEALCCFDFTEGGLLTDDEIADIFADLRTGARGLILSDSCHSGTVTRTIDMNLSRSGVRFISPAAFTDLSASQAKQAEIDKDTKKSRPYASLVSGCMDLEYSWDASFVGKPNGAFSRYAIDAYEPGITLNNWFRKIRTKLPTTIYPQTPQLSATAYRKYTRAL